MSEDQAFVRLAERTDAAEYPAERAPARLKSRLYSVLMQQQAATGALRSVSVVRAEGRPLCVFERSLELLPIGEHIKTMNPCRVCHARVLGERFEAAPIFWSHCPYVEFRR